jgi:hypothetical protein
VTQVHRVGTDTTHAPPCGGPLTRQEQGDAGRAYTPDDAGFRAAGTGDLECKVKRAHGRIRMVQCQRYQNAFGRYLGMFHIWQ